MACNTITCNCNTCSKFVATTAVTLTGGNLVLQIPSNNYVNNGEVCICVAQSIPAGVTAATPVVVQIGAAVTTYPMKTKCGHNVYGDQIKSRKLYCTRVATDTAVFVYNGRCPLPCTKHIFPGSLPITQVTETVEVLDTKGVK